jgi:hypothetical protein
MKITSDFFYFYNQETKTNLFLTTVPDIQFPTEFSSVLYDETEG